MYLFYLEANYFTILYWFCPVCETAKETQMYRTVMAIFNGQCLCHLSIYYLVFLPDVLNKAFQQSFLLTCSHCCLCNEMSDFSLLINIKPQQRTLCIPQLVL